MRMLDLFCGRWGWSKAFAARGWECVLYHVRPGFPLIESAMAEERNKSLMKVSVALFTAALHLGVREV